MIWQDIREKREYFRTAAKKRKARLRSEGRCTICGCELDRSGSLCSSCCEKAVRNRSSRGLKDRAVAENGSLKCIGCGQTKHVSEFVKCHNGVERYCKPCWNAKSKELRRKTRMEALVHYSGSETPFCACCGETNYEFLSIDHIDGNGCQHRKQTGYKDLSRWCKANGWPDGFRILCHNCNFSRGHYGFCPHERN